MMSRNQKRIFITGTDTGVGKTFFTAALVSALQNAQRSVIAFKPVAAGCELMDGKLKNEDALVLMDAMNEDISYKTINPISLRQPIAPHLSALEDGVELSVSRIRQVCRLSDYSHSTLLIEGAGGWLVPLNKEETFADYAVAESLEVILVVGMKLGCINHALLTQQSILDRGLKLTAWVANQIDPQMLYQSQNIETLSKRLDCPLIAQIPYIEGDNSISKASRCVRIELLYEGESC